MYLTICFRIVKFFLCNSKRSTGTDEVGFHLEDSVRRSDKDAIETKLLLTGEQMLREKEEAKLSHWTCFDKMKRQLSQQRKGDTGNQSRDKMESVEEAVSKALD